MSTKPSPFRRSPEREFVFGTLGLLWLSLVAAFGLRIEIAITVAVLLAVGYFTLRLIQRSNDWLRRPNSSQKRATNSRIR